MAMIIIASINSQKVLLDPRLRANCARKESYKRHESLWGCMLCAPLAEAAKGGGLKLMDAPPKILGYS